MKKNLAILCLFVLTLGGQLIAQAPPSTFTYPDFHTITGQTGSIPGRDDCISIFDALPSGVSISTNSSGHYEIDDKQIDAAIGNLPSNGLIQVLYFPAGTYLIDSTVTVGRSNVVLKGAGSNATIFKWIGKASGDPDSANVNKFCIDISGGGFQTGDGETFDCTGSETTNTITANESMNGTIAVGDLICLIRDNPVGGCDTDFAIIRQFAKVTGINGNDLTLDRKLRIDFGSANNGRFRKVGLVRNSGIECLKVDATGNSKTNRDGSPQTGNIRFQAAFNCWAKGIESEKPVYHHILIDNCNSIKVNGCYLHEAWNYGQSKGYGILLQNGASDCRVENNIVMTTRHSIVLQDGANGNVLSYNYTDDSKDGDNSDLIIHGNFPFHNLIEGNSTEYIHVDLEGCINGDGNLIFRNDITKKKIRAGWSYWFWINPGAVDLAAIGNEAKACSDIFVQDQDSLHEWANIYDGNCGGEGGNSSTIGYSIAYSSKPSFLSWANWPTFGPNSSSSSQVPAKWRYDNLTTKTVGSNCSECVPPPPPAPLNVWYFIDPCYSGNITQPGLVTLSIVGGTPPYSTSWTGSFTTTTNTSALFFSPTLWSATVTDAAGATKMVSGFTGNCQSGGPLKTALPDAAEATLQFSVLAYPNPFEDVTAISIELPEEGKVTAEVYSLDGRKVGPSHVDQVLPAGTHEFVLPFHGMASGIYLCRVSYNAEVHYIRLVAK